MNSEKVGVGGGNQAGESLYCLMRHALLDNLTSYQKLDDASVAVSFFAMYSWCFSERVKFPICPEI